MAPSIFGEGMTLIPTGKRFRGSFIRRERSIPCISLPGWNTADIRWVRDRREFISRNATSPRDVPLAREPRCILVGRMWIVNGNYNAIEKVEILHGKVNRKYKIIFQLRVLATNKPSTGDGSPFLYGKMNENVYYEFPVYGFVFKKTCEVWTYFRF